MEKTDRFLVKDGVTEYQIVFDKTKDGELYKFAVEELQYFFKEATGIELTAISDEGLTYTNSSKYISLGETSILESAELDVDKDFIGVQGVRILTKGDTIFLYGNSGDSVLNSVYFFLQLTLGYDHYVTDYVIERDVKEVSLFNYDVVEIPDATYRNLGQDMIYTSKTLARRLMSSETQGADRIQVQNSEDGSKSVSANHCALIYCPPGKFNDPNKPETYHPDWFSSDNTQLCFTAHGNEEEYSLMIEQIIEVGKRNLIRDTESNILPFSSMDQVTVCGCEACSIAYEQYGANSGAHLKVANELYKGIMEWFETEEGKPYARELKVTMLAYNEYTAAPIKKDDKGEMVSTIKAESGISISFAPINMDWNKSIYDEANSSFSEAFDGWKLVTEDFSYWFYTTNFTNFYAPFNCLDSLQENYQAMVGSTNCTWITDCGVRTFAPTSWQTLLIYLDSKLMWNVNIDFEYYVKKFCDMAYGVVAEEMYEMLMEFRIHSKIAQANGFVGDIYLSNFYTNNAGEELWPKAVMLKWVDKYDYILEQVEVYKESDPEKYDAYYNAIARERLMPLYMLAEHYKDELSKDDLLKFRTQFKNDCLSFGENTLGDFPKKTLLADVYSSWGI